MFNICCTTSLCMPSLGGSVIITSGCPCVLINSSLKTCFISPTKNSTLLMLFNCAFSLAAVIASGTDSTPITLLACFATNCAMVPVPVYKS